MNDRSIPALFEDARNAGVLGAESSTLLTGHLGPVMIAGAAGLALEDIVATDVMLISVLIDASSSIAMRRLSPAVREGQRAMLKAFANSRERDSILVAQWCFSDQAALLHAHVGVDAAARLDEKNYRPRGGTALYDTWCDALGAHVAYAEHLKNHGTPCRSVAVVLTDGEDTTSRRSARDCAVVNRDLLASEQFVLAFVGVGAEADFAGVALAMGFAPGSVAVLDHATEHTLRAAFDLVSRSAIRASQGLVQPGPQAGFFVP